MEIFKNNYSQLKIIYVRNMAVVWFWTNRYTLTLFLQFNFQLLAKEFALLNFWKTSSERLAHKHNNNTNVLRHGLI